MKLIRIAFTIMVAAFAAVSAHAQYSCSVSNLNGKFAIEGGGKKVELNVLGLIALEQEHDTAGYIVLDGAGNITDGKIDEDIDNTITEHTAVTGNYTFNGLNGCDGTLMIQAADYQRTFNLSVTVSDPTSHAGSQIALLPNGGNGEDEVYTGDLTQDPSTTNLAANSSMSKLTSNAAGGCTADMLVGDSFSGRVDGGTGGNVKKGTFNTTFNPGQQEGFISIGWVENDIVDGILQPKSTTTYNGVVDPDCSIEVYSGTTKVGEFYLINKVPTNSVLSAGPAAAAASSSFHPPLIEGILGGALL